MNSVSRLYVSYLSTSSLIRCVEDLERKLNGRPIVSNARAEVLGNVRDDCLEELARRQGTLWSRSDDTGALLRAANSELGGYGRVNK
jgi:hypothetical protein